MIKSFISFFESMSEISLVLLVLFVFFVPIIVSQLWFRYFPSKSHLLH